MPYATHHFGGRPHEQAGATYEQRPFPQGLRQEQNFPGEQISSASMNPQYALFDFTSYTDSCSFHSGRNNSTSTSLTVSHLWNERIRGLNDERDPQN